MSRNTTLGEIANIITGPFGSQLHMSDYVDIGVPVIMPQDIIDGTVSMDNISYIGENNYLRLIRYAVKPNDIIFARRGDIEKHAFITDDSQLLCGTGCFRVRITDSTVYPLFLSYYLDRLETRKWLVAHAVGTNMPNLNTAILASVPVELPDCTDQVKIGDFLYNMEKKIQYNKKIIDNLQHQLKLIYDYWFTQFDFPDKNGKPYRSSGGAMVWNEQLKRNIPKSWVVKPIGSICDFKNGINYKKNEQGNKKYRIVNVRNISTSQLLLNPDNFDYIILDDKKADKYLLSNNDFLIARSGSPGATRLFIPSNEPTIYCGFIICCSTSMALKNYVALTLKNLESSNDTKSSGSILKNVSQDTLKEIMICVPQSHILNMFNTKADTIIQAMQETIKEIDALCSLRDWLLPMLMNGQASIVDEREEKPQIKISRFKQWLANQGFAARGGVDMDVLRDIYEAMDDDDK